MPLSPVIAGEVRGIKLVPHKKRGRFEKLPEVFDNYLTPSLESHSLHVFTSISGRITPFFEAIFCSFAKSLGVLPLTHHL
jgi:hypothetical protein